MKNLKIDIGAGDSRDGESSPEGYLRQDVDPNIPGLDIVCNIKDLLRELGNRSCEKIRASHVLEHFGFNEIDDIFLMLYDLLENGGELEVIVPNFAWHAQLVFEGKDEEAIWYAFGGQKDEWDYHKIGFTPKTLLQRLNKAGFLNVKIIDGSSITAIAKKYEDQHNHSDDTQRRFRDFEKFDKKSDF